MEEKRQRMRELVERLREASKAYYQEDREIMSNFEYDKLYDELAGLEAETGIVLSGSPTQNVGYESQEELPKERHERPMLSLDKTKDVEVLKTFVGDVLEAGRSDYRTHLPEWRTQQGCYQRKRRGGRGHHSQRSGIFQHSA